MGALVVVGEFLLDLIPAHHPPCHHAIEVIELTVGVGLSNRLQLLPNLLLVVLFESLITSHGLNRGPILHFADVGNVIQVSRV